MVVNLTCSVPLWLGVSWHEYILQGQVESCELSKSLVRKKKRKREFACHLNLCKTSGEMLEQRTGSLFAARCSSVENRPCYARICKQWQMSHGIKGSWKDTQFVVLLPFSLPAALSSPLASRLLCKTPAEMEKWDGWQRARCPGIKRRLSLWWTPCRPSPVWLTSSCAHALCNSKNLFTPGQISANIDIAALFCAGPFEGWLFCLGWLASYLPLSL